MACACGKKKTSTTATYTVVSTSEGTVYGPYRSRSEADAVATRHPGSIVRSSSSE